MLKRELLGRVDRSQAPQKHLHSSVNTQDLWVNHITVRLLIDQQREPSCRMPRPSASPAIDRAHSRHSLPSGRSMASFARATLGLTLPNKICFLLLWLIGFGPRTAAAQTSLSELSQCGVRTLSLQMLTRLLASLQGGPRRSHAANTPMCSSPASLSRSPTLPAA